MTITESLKRFRGDYKLTQKTVSDILGMSQQSYYYYESKGDPPSTAIVKLAKTYGVSTDYLLGLTDEPNQALAPVPAPEDEFTRAAIVFADAMRNAVNQRLQEKAEV